MVVGREISLEQCCILLALIIFCTKSTCQSSITSNESMPITQVLNTGIGNRNQSISSTPTSGTVIAANTLKTDGSMKLTSTVKMTFDQMQSPGPNSTGICKYFTPYIDMANISILDVQFQTKNVQHINPLESIAFFSINIRAQQESSACWS